MRFMKMVKLLALVTLFAGCNVVQGPEKPIINEGGNGEDNGRVSRVQVTIGDNARTILPDLKEGFSKFILSAEPIEGNTQSAPSPVEITDGSSVGTIAIPYGDWVITATAYVNVSGVDYPAAKGSAPLYVYETNHWITIKVNAPELGGTGTFNYTVAYPSDGSAQLTLAPFGNGTPVIDASVSSGVMGTQDIPSGVYFLTVAATAREKTVIRNEVVHIYPYSVTNADYVFTKPDFGDSLNLSGTVKVLVNGEQPDEAYLYLSTIQNSWDVPINFSGNDGNGTWSISLSNVQGVNTFEVYVIAGSFLYKQLPDIAVPVDDTDNIDLGTVDIAFKPVPLPADTWVDGNITTSSTEDWYSIDVTAGTTYYFWLNNGHAGDGTKTLYGYFEGCYSNGSYIFGAEMAWYDPVSFTADYSGTVYIRVSGWGNTGTYAIGYSTDSYWHNNSLNPDNAVPLPADTWVDGNITVSYAVDMYSINVTAGTTYYVWWNDRYSGDGTGTLDVDVYAYTDGGGIIFYGDDIGYESMSFTVDHSGTVYIRVRALNGGYSTGTYAIMYSTTRRSRVEAEIRTAFETNNNLYFSYDSWVYKGYELYVQVYDYMSYSHNPDLTYTWFIDGVQQDVYTETYSSWYRAAYTYLPTSGLSAGTHYGLVVVTIDGAAFAREFEFHVYE